MPSRGGPDDARRITANGFENGSLACLNSAALFRSVDGFEISDDCGDLLGGETGGDIGHDRLAVDVARVFDCFDRVGVGSAAHREERNFSAGLALLEAFVNCPVL